MHKEILSKKQLEFLAFLKNFSQDFFLVGGTAIALHIGHRRSIDFDLFTFNQINHLQIQNIVNKERKIQRVFVDNKQEYTILVNDIKLTFLHYPFKLSPSNDLDETISLPDLESLAALKAYAIGRRSKWKDYVDLYYIFKSGISIESIIDKAKHIFASSFNEKLFRAQLSYFKDIDFTEKVDFLKGFEVGDGVIKEELRKISLV